jgi:hypothetical protein
MNNFPCICQSWGEQFKSGELKGDSFTLDEPKYSSKKYNPTFLE